jgi:hypothetical protein
MFHCSSNRTTEVEAMAMSTEAIARRLVEMCRKGMFNEAQDELFADDAASIEPEGSPFPPARGRAALREKSKQFEASLEAIHGITVSDPVVAGNYFSCAMTLDMTQKGSARTQFSEICVFKVRNGKIVNEQFFYDLG